MSVDRWWVFDRPLLRDPLFIAGLAVGLASVVYILLSRGDDRVAALVFALVTAVPSAVIAIGTVGGIVREYIRGRRR